MRSKAFFQSLLVTSTLSFMLPIVLIGTLVVSLFLITQIPVAQSVSEVMVFQLMQILKAFGTGSAIEGSLVIATTCSLVGILFDTYAFHNRLKGNA